MSIQNIQQFESSYTVLLYVTLYTIIRTHKELSNDTDNAQLLHHVTVLCLKVPLKIFSGETTGTLCS